MRTQRTASTLATDLADSHAPRRAGGDASRSRSKSRFSGSASAILSQLEVDWRRLASRDALARGCVGDCHGEGRSCRERRSVDQSAASASRCAARRCEWWRDETDSRAGRGDEQGRAEAGRAQAADGRERRNRQSAAEHDRVSHTNPEIESDDELFELPLPATERAPQKTLLQLFNEEHAFQHAPASPAQMQTQNTAAAPEYDDDLIEVDLHSGRVNAGAKASEPSEPSAPAGPKSALRKPGAARREAGPRVSWHPDVRDTKLASAASVATPATPTGPTGRARRSGITGMLGRMVQLPRKLWR